MLNNPKKKIHLIICSSIAITSLVLFIFNFKVVSIFCLKLLFWVLFWSLLIILFISFLFCIFSVPYAIIMGIFGKPVSSMSDFSANKPQKLRPLIEPYILTRQRFVTLRIIDSFREMYEERELRNNKNKII